MHGSLSARPSGLVGLGPLDGSPLPGDLVDEERLLLFRVAIAKRNPYILES